MTHGGHGAARSDPPRPPERPHPHAILRLQKLIYAVDVARALDSPELGDHPAGRWTTRRARKWLQKSGAGFQLSPRGPWVTTRQRLKERFPDVLDLLLVQLADEDIDLL